jgi:methylated-DNA-protein-cysteine methyltransferase related protein
MTELDRALLAVVAALQEGQVVSYAWVAAEAGFPGRARAVGAALQAPAANEVPWWRVVRTDGRIVSPSAARQQRLLAAEGVVVRGGRVVEPPVQRP